MELKEITSATGELVEPHWLSRAEVVHRQLRPQLPPDYVGKMKRVFASGGRMCVVALDDSVVGLAVFRVFENTLGGLELYVDDLVTDEAQRSRGAGKMMIAHVEAVARALGCWAVTLDSGCHRGSAHKFYFREGFRITSFHFTKELH